MGLQKTFAQLVGIIIALVGLLGFFVEGVFFNFGLNPLHNIVHLVGGLLVFWYGMKTSGKTPNVTLCIIGVVLAIIGWLNIAAINSLLAINGPDNWLHLIIGVIALAVGFGAKE